MLFEMLIALFLVGIVALPLADLPVRALREEVKSIYRLQAESLSNQFLSLVKEKLYTNEIAWNEIIKATERKIPIFEDQCLLSFPPYHKTLQRKCFLRSIGIKKQGMEEWHLMIARIELTSGDKLGLPFKKKAFAHYILLHKT